MKLGTIVIVIACGCGGPGAQTPSNRSGASSAVPGRAELCKRAAQLHDEGCAPFDRVEEELLATCSIVDGIYMAAMEDCIRAPSCKDVQTCAGDVRHSGRAYRGPTAPCSARESTIPAGVSATDVEASYGRRGMKFSDSPSSAVKPIEVCGMPAQLEYLTRVTCNDGSKPFADRGAADRSRVGNVGPGGRCNRVVDEYRVTCPEQEYDVFIDPYRCPAR